MYDGPSQHATLAHHFTGKERDSESGLDNFGARYYSSSFGRFASSDPKMVSHERMLDPQQWNMYQYGRNNPLTMIDPDGREVKIATEELQESFDHLMKSEKFRKAVAPYQGKEHDLTIKRGELGYDEKEPARKILGDTEPERHGGVRTCSPDCGPPNPITLKNVTITIDDSVKPGKGKEEIDGVLGHEISHGNDAAKDPGGSLKEIQDNAGKLHDDKSEEQRADQFSKDVRREAKDEEKKEMKEIKERQKDLY